MILNSENYSVRRAFSDAAKRYENLSSLQYEIGCKLIENNFSSSFRGRVLDVGMGTGQLTDRLSGLCPDAKIVGIDFASGMVFRAKETYATFKGIVADAQALPFVCESFDAVISNAAYQWMRDLPTAFKQANRVLKKSGRFYAALFGRETLHELFESLESISGFRANKEKFVRLADENSVKKAFLDAGFGDIECHSQISTMSFENLRSLLLWLKAIGANRLNPRMYLGPEIFLKAEEYYQKYFKAGTGLTASFEVIWMKGKK